MIRPFCSVETIVKRPILIMKRYYPAETKRTLFNAVLRDLIREEAPF